MYRLNGNNGDKIGLGIVMKVMSGDQVSILGKSYWTGSSINNSYPLSTNDLLMALGSSNAVTTADKGITGTGLSY